MARASVALRCSVPHSQMLILYMLSETEVPFELVTTLRDAEEQPRQTAESPFEPPTKGAVGLRKGSLELGIGRQTHFNAPLAQTLHLLDIRSAFGCKLVTKVSVVVIVVGRRKGGTHAAR